MRDCHRATLGASAVERVRDPAVQELTLSALRLPEEHLAQSRLREVDAIVAVVTEAAGTHRVVDQLGNGVVVEAGDDLHVVERAAVAQERADEQEVTGVGAERAETALGRCVHAQRDDGHRAPREHELAGSVDRGAGGQQVVEQLADEKRVAPGRLHHLEGQTARRPRGSEVEQQVVHLDRVEPVELERPCSGLTRDSAEHARRSGVSVHIADGEQHTRRHRPVVRGLCERPDHMREEVERGSVGPLQRVE